MPITGEYEPSSAAWVRDQVAEYEASGGTRANTLRNTGIPVFPPYADYQLKTDRLIPVLVASPA